MLVHLIENLPRDIVIYLLQDVLKLVIGDDIWVIWDFYALVVFFVSFRLLEIFYLLVFLADVLVVVLATISGISWVVPLIVAVFLGVSKGSIV